ncbi:MAG TPA: ribosome silencing factor [Clostridia bacterium]|nr:MAG: Ribosomal silencing factor RsfS [Firmicutes bacterium ADurb.Bin146]HOD93484.1 ribosome silencing factor [Clostridia bacterium]HQM39778.1 ribosome silencing factor [Clostridia bacterium]
MDTENIKNEIVNVLKDKKAKDLISIDVKDVTTLTDYFIICTGTSDRHRKSLADEVAKKAEALGMTVSAPIEGYNQAKWILIDCMDLVVNIFEKESRAKYNLEKLWSDGVLEDIRENSSKEEK